MNQQQKNNNFLYNLRKEEKRKELKKTKLTKEQQAEELDFYCIDCYL